MILFKYINILYKIQINIKQNNFKLRNMGENEKVKESWYSDLLNKFKNMTIGATMAESSCNNDSVWMKIE